MLTLLLILCPLVMGLLLLLSKGNSSKTLAIISSVIVLLLSAYIQNQYNSSIKLEFDIPWLISIKSHFHLKITSWNILMIHLNAFAYLVVYAWISNQDIKNANKFYALMNFTQAGLMGVFMAFDALTFYFFWELALIPVYFLSSIWGGPKRIQTTFKFFIYTFLGSVMMLIALIYLYYRHQESFSWQEWISYPHLVASIDQKWIFFLMLIAFAIKIPLFPFHTWQPQTYQQAPRGTVMILSAVMAKMGLFAIIQWQIFILPDAFSIMGKVVIVLATISILYASLIAMIQNNLIKIVAYSSIAHLGLMALALFTDRQNSVDAVSYQMLSHGIVVLGLWMCIDLIQKKYNTVKINELPNGIASQSPAFAIVFTVLAFANIALPLTSSFVGEFIILKCIFHYNHYLMIIAGLSIILGAIYTLRMVRKILFGSGQGEIKMDRNQSTILFGIVIIVLVIGIYPKPILELVSTITTQINNISK